MFPNIGIYNRPMLFIENDILEETIEENDLDYLFYERRSSQVDLGFPFECKLLVDETNHVKAGVDKL